MNQNWINVCLFLLSWLLIFGCGKQTDEDLNFTIPAPDLVCDYEAIVDTFQHDTYSYCGSGELNDYVFFYHIQYGFLLCFDSRDGDSNLEYFQPSDEYVSQTDLFGFYTSNINIPVGAFSFSLLHLYFNYPSDSSVFVNQLVPGRYETFDNTTDEKCIGKLGFQFGDVDYLHKFKNAPLDHNSYNEIQYIRYLGVQNNLNIWQIGGSFGGSASNEDNTSSKYFRGLRYRIRVATFRR